MVSMFWCFMCGNCGRWGSKEVNVITKAVFKCVYCNKTKKVKLKNQLGFTLNNKGPFGPYEAVSVCQNLNDKRGNK